MLTGKVAVLFIGADSEVELKEKKDRVDDALHATKAALAEGIVAGGGVALLNASQIIESKSAGHDILLAAITSPYHTILENAGYADIMNPKEYVEGNKDIEDKGWCYRNMIDSGIVDPVLVTKTALKNAISVATTIVSADCIISNVRSLESN
jgi:chaperonin GroEL